jgi:hypothetical protein
MTVGVSENQLNVFNYGTQSPIISEPQILDLVTDVDDTQRGPAWFFQLPYDKLVIVQENAISAFTKRANHPSPDDFKRKQTAQAGDKPWFCFWNGTLLETFIFTNQTSSYANQGNSSSTQSSSQAPASSTTAAARVRRDSSAYEFSSTTTSNGASSATSTQPTQSPTMYSSWAPAFPKIVKVEERRIPEGSLAVPPYCVQMQIMNDGQASPVLNSTGLPTTIYINETEPTFATMGSGSKRSMPSKDLWGRDDELSERDAVLVERQSSSLCSCEWLVS